jgi:hypothetical protein
MIYVSDIQLPRDPTAALHATTKQYVDAGLTTKAASSHTHTTSQITGLGTAATCNTGTASGNVPVLDTSGKLNISVLPALAITDTFVVATQAAMLALTCERGDLAIRTDLNKTFVLRQEPASTLANWQEILSPTGDVISVNGKTGTVVLVAADVGAIPVTEKGVANGVATLDASVKIPIAQLPTQSTISNSSTAVPTGAAVYAHSNATTAHSATATPTASRITMWDANKRLKSDPPSATDDVATKGYVDGVTGGHRSTITGNGTLTDFPVTHGLNSEEVKVSLFKNTTPLTPIGGIQWTPTTTNQITLSFAVAPLSTDTYIVHVTKWG